MPSAIQRLLLRNNDRSKIRQGESQTIPQRPLARAQLNVQEEHQFHQKIAES